MSIDGRGIQRAWPLSVSPPFQSSPLPAPTSRYSISSHDAQIDTRQSVEAERLAMMEQLRAMLQMFESKPAKMGELEAFEDEEVRLTAEIEGLGSRLAYVRENKNVLRDELADMNGFAEKYKGMMHVDVTAAQEE